MTPNRVPLGPLVRSLPHTLKRDPPLSLPLPCMHARKSNHGGQPRRTLGPTRTSSTRVRAPDGSVGCGVGYHYSTRLYYDHATSPPVAPQRPVAPQARPMSPRAAVAPQKFAVMPRTAVTTQLFLWQHRSAATGKRMAQGPGRMRWRRNYGTRLCPLRRLHRYGPRQRPTTGETVRGVCRGPLCVALQHT